MARHHGNSFDYVIVGAGSAGCVLANRLSADSRHTVAITEAGGQDRWIWFHIPAGYLFAIGNPRADWMFRTEPDPGLNGRSLAYPRGKVIGGSSAINAMIYMRGQAADYDHWRQMGLRGWGWNDVLPYFRRQQDHFAGRTEFHGASRSDPVRRQRGDACPSRTLRHRRGGALACARHTGSSSSPGRGGKSAGPSAAALCVQGPWRAHHEHGLSLLRETRSHGAAICAGAARALDHGAVAARRLHALLAAI